MVRLPKGPGLNECISSVTTTQGSQQGNLETAKEAMGHKPRPQSLLQQSSNIAGRAIQWRERMTNLKLSLLKDRVK